MKEQITIVIPVYNRRHTLERSLGSVSAQTVRDFKLVLVDNGSTDGSLEFMESWARKQDFPVEILSEPRRGAAAARARGAEAVTTPWVKFYDSDDSLSPDYVERFLEVIRLHPDVQLVGGDCGIYEYEGGPLLRMCVFSTRDMQYASLMHGVMATARWAVRTDLLREAGSWNPDMAVGDDIELGARILSLNPRTQKIAGPEIGQVFMSSDSISTDEQAGSYKKVAPALRAIAATLGPRYRHWIWLKEIILAANSHSQAGKNLKDKVMAEATSHRMLLRMAYLYTRVGGRGIARIYRGLGLV